MDIVRLVDEANSSNSEKKMKIMTSPKTVSILSSLPQYIILQFIEKYDGLLHWLQKYLKTPADFEELIDTLRFNKMEAGLHHVIVKGTEGNLRFDIDENFNIVEEFDLTLNQFRAKSSDPIRNVVPDWFLRSQTFRDMVNLLRKSSLEKFFVCRYIASSNLPHELTEYVNLRDKNSPRNHLLEWQIETLHRCIDDITPIEQDLLLWRGEGCENSYSLLKKKKIISTTFLEKIAKIFIKDKPNSVLLHITLKKGSRMLPIFLIDGHLSVRQEWEVLIKPPMKIQEIRRENDNGQIIIYLEISTYRHVEYRNRVNNKSS